MPEVNIVVRAKDEATKTLKGVGGALGGLGKIAAAATGIAVVGVAAVGAAATKLALDAAAVEPVA